MAEKHLHIISFNVPYPPTYGGVIDVFYKLKALHEKGVKIHLHCFQYGRKESEELKQYCEEIIYYNRDKFWKGIFSDKPFIVQSRNASELIENLNKDKYPVLFEGLHSCFFLPDDRLKNRTKIVRMHNDEAAYYFHLATKEHRILKRLYFYAEYRRLMKYEQVLQFADFILCISKAETRNYKKKYENVSYLGPFHGNKLVRSKTGKGNYALYHGNLEVNENAEAVQFLVEEVFQFADKEFIIAGNQPSQQLVELINQYPKIRLISNPSEKELNELIADAQINILPTFMETGIKLKLINALFKGRFCIVNDQMVAQTGLEKYCIIANNAEEIKIQLQELFQKEFTVEDISFRRTIETELSDLNEAEKIVSLL